MKTFNSIEKLFLATDGKQLNAQEIINRRANVDGEWQDIELTAEFMSEFIEAIVDILGGRNMTQSYVRYNLRRSTPQHWGLSRIVLSKYGSSPARWSYCAGQDCPSEISQIRKYLAK